MPQLPPRFFALLCFDCYSLFVGRKREEQRKYITAPRRMERGSGCVYIWRSYSAGVQPPLPALICQAAAPGRTLAGLALPAALRRER